VVEVGIGVGNERVGAVEDFPPIGEAVAIGIDNSERPAGGWEGGVPVGGVVAGGLGGDALE
jgi:hypothetical protein